jgi:hypothetical protein
VLRAKALKKNLVTCPNTRKWYRNKIICKLVLPTASIFTSVFPVRSFVPSMPYVHTKTMGGAEAIGAGRRVAWWRARNSHP